MAGPNMKRDQSLAGQSVKQGGYTVTYDSMGYATGAVRDGGASATSSKKTTNANNSPTHQAAYQAAQQGDWDRVGTIINGLAVDSGYGDGTKSMKDANAYLGELQDEFLYNPNEYYKAQYEKAFGKGSWDGTGGGSMALTTGSRGNGYGGYGSFESFVNGMGYDDYEEQTRKYIQAAVENAVNGYNRQIDTVNRDTQELARQAYIANMLGQKNMDQQLSASGLAGGMADSQRIGLQANYENNLNELEMQRQATVAELQLAIENARLTGDMQTAQELAGYLQQLQGQWVNYLQNQQQLENQNYWNTMNMQQENQNTARNWVLTMIQNGTLPDEATLTAAGMTTADAQNMLNYVRQQNAPKVTPTPQESSLADRAGLALMGLANGNTNPEAIALVESYYKLPWQTLVQSQGGTPGNEMPTSDFSRIENQMNLIASEETPAAAQKLLQNMVDQYWDQMSEGQQQKITNLLTRYGF